MPRYKVTVREVIFLEAEFEAENEEEAQKLASENKAAFTEVDGRDAEIVSTLEIRPVAPL